MVQVNLHSIQQEKHSLETELEFFKNVDEIIIINHKTLLSKRFRIVSKILMIGCKHLPYSCWSLLRGENISLSRLTCSKAMVCKRTTDDKVKLVYSIIKHLLSDTLCRTLC